MKAAFLTGLGQFEVRDIPNPKIKASTDVLIKVETVGICGSDLHYFRTRRIGNQVVQYPFLVGHECAGTVLEVGKDVARVQPGDRIAVEPAVTCGTCDQCLEGRPHTCRNLLFLGCPGELDGCLTEQLVMPESCCFTIGPEMPFQEAVFVEPLAIGLYAWKFLSGLNIQNIGILGVGAIGLSVLLPAHDNGVRDVYVTDKLDDRLRAAQNLGAGFTANPDKTDAVKAAPRELDAVFECCGQQDALIQAVHMIKPGGHLLILGIPEVDDISLPIHYIRRKEITIHNVRRQNGMMRSAIDCAAKNLSKISSLITHQFDLGDIQKAFEINTQYQDGVIKTVINI